MLAMSLITPGFLIAGVLLASVPIIIHILNRRRFKVVRWAAMEYLLAAMRKNRRRLRFEQWILLATRCLVLALLGLALARPLACSQTNLAAAGAQRSGLHVIVIDNSYSMGYEAHRPDARTHLQQAKLLAKQLIDRLSSGGESVVILTAANPASAVISQPSYDLQAAKAAIDRIEQTTVGTDLAGALQLALHVAESQPAALRRDLYLLTDGTRSAWDAPRANQLQQLGQQLAKLYHVTHFNLGGQNQWNQAVLDLHPQSNLLTTRFNNEFIADIKGFGPPSDATLQWKLDNQPLPGGGTIKPDTQTPPQIQSQLMIRTGGPHIISVSAIGQDALPIDNVRRRVVDVVSELKVLVVEGDHGVGLMSGSAAFLTLALAPPADALAHGNAKSNSVIEPELISDLELANKVLADYRAVIFTNVAQIGAAQADQLRQFVQRGGTLMLFMGEQVNADNYNTILLPRHLMPGPLTKRMSVGSDQNGFTFDFNPNGSLHPLLSLFRGEDKSGLDTAQVFTYWQVVPDGNGVERVLNYLPAGASPSTTTSTTSNAHPADPAITVQSLGAGRIVFFSTTANADWTSFPAKPAYVTLMHELLLGSVNSNDDWMNVIAGQPLVLPSTLKLTAAPTLTDPAQKPIVLNQSSVDGSQPLYRSPPLTTPGVYLLSTGTLTFPIVVNPPADEADVRTLDNGAIKAALGDIDIDLQGDVLLPEPADRDRGNDLGWTVMLLVLVLVAAESFMAMRFGHYRRGTAQVS
jgi:hypothetical protein